MTRQEAVDFLLYRPVDFAHLLGFDKLTDLHNDWIINMVRGTKDDTLRAHRGSYKTTCVSFALSIIIILLPNCRTAFLRKTDADVKEVIRQVQNILKDPHAVYLVQCIYGIQLKLTVESATEVSTNLTTDIKGTSQLVGYGTGASLTGKHFDRIFTDDIINVKDRISKAERDHTKLIYQELQNIKNRGGRIFNTGTPWHKNDAFELMPKATDYDCYSTGLISEEELAHIKASMAPSLFAANYEMRHIASDDVMFTDPKTGADPKFIQNAKSHIDAAYGGEDWTAFTAMNKIDNTYYILGKCWQKHVDDALGEIFAVMDDNLLNKVYCEDNGDKGYLAKDIRSHGKRAITYHESMNKFIKISTYLKAIWDHVVFVEGTDPEYIEQICDYTEDAEHDDACLDGNTMIATLTGNKPIKDIKIGEYVITPAGIRKVTFAGITGYKKVDNYHGVNSTHDHKFFTYNQGFKTADSLDSADRIDTIGLRGLLSWKKRLLYSTEKPISEIQRADIISSTQPKTQKEEMRNNFIERCGNITTEKFLKAITYIISMAMLTITTLAIWSVYQLGNICRCMQKEIFKMKIIENATKNCYFKQEKKQKNGINQREVENGIENMQQNQLSKQANTKRLRFVNFAVKNFLQQKRKDFVALIANKRQGVEELDLNSFLMKSNVHVAETHLQQSQQNINSVHHYANNDIMPVYNLTVEKAGCYYANGVLVSNCDSAACLARLLYKKKSNDDYKPMIYH